MLGGGRSSFCLSEEPRKVMEVRGEDIRTEPQAGQKQANQANID